MRINVHAGHNPAGKVACGAVGLIQESVEDRRVKDEVINQLRQLGHAVYDCTVDNGTGQKDVLQKSRCFGVFQNIKTGICLYTTISET